MKTLILNGSPRKSGNTAYLVGRFKERLGGEFLEVGCYTADISPCVDCRCCRNGPRCALGDEMQEVYEYLDKCDNVVVASPVYFAELTGRLLDVASRFQMYCSANIFRHEKILTAQKRGGAILTCGGSGGGERAFETASMILKSVSANVIFPPVICVNTDLTEARKDADAINGALALADKFKLTEKK